MLNFEPSMDLFKVTADAIVRALWTPAEMEIATELFRTDAAVAKEARYAGAVTCDVFAAVKEDPRVMVGKLWMSEDVLAIARKLTKGRQRDFQRVQKAFRPVWREGSKRNRFELMQPEVLIQVAA